jgi:hypothetical protein
MSDLEMLHEDSEQSDQIVRLGQLKALVSNLLAKYLRRPETLSLLTPLTHDLGVPGEDSSESSDEGVIQTYNRGMRHN